MKIVGTLAAQAGIAKLPFLMIGGNAVIAYGFPRQTADLDLLVREADRDAWDKLLVPLGYRIYFAQGAFQMYNPSVPNLPAIDLMLVDHSTFGKLAADAGETSMGGTILQIPSLRHLIALKLHALKSGQPHRMERDMLDVITLVQLNRVDLAKPDYVEILERYASPAVRAELRRRLAGPESAGS